MRKFKLEDNRFLAKDNNSKSVRKLNNLKETSFKSKFQNLVTHGRLSSDNNSSLAPVKYKLKLRGGFWILGIIVALVIPIILGIATFYFDQNQVGDSTLIVSKSAGLDISYVVNPIEERINPGDYFNLEKDIIDRIGNLDDNYSVYVKDMYTGYEIFINAKTDFPPASVYKVPLAMVVLKDIDDGVVTWDQELLVTAAEKPYSFDALSIRSGSYYITVEELLFYLITYSDNTAMTTLEHRLGGVELLQERMKTEFGFENVTRTPHIANAVTFGRVFESLYNQEFLSEESNDYLIDLLKNVTSVHNDRIVAGLPDGIEAAHKIGTLVATYHDAGIVYGEERDYVLVILNKQIIPANAVKVVKDISRITYVGLN